MPVTISVSTVNLQRHNSLTFELSDFDIVYQSIVILHSAKNRKIEKEASHLISNKFQPNDSYNFMTSVIEWGKGHRFLERAQSKNTNQEISDALKDGYHLGKSGKASDMADAVAQIAQLKQIGHSFATKYLRMLLPKNAATLDSRIRDKIGYGATKLGYMQFIDDLRQILGHVRNFTSIPQKTRNAIRICDVEMVVYALAGR